MTKDERRERLRNVLFGILWETDLEQDIYLRLIDQIEALYAERGVLKSQQ